MLAAAAAGCRFQPNTDITAMTSVEGEVVPLKKRIKPSAAGGAVEKWLVQVGLCVCTQHPKPAHAQAVCITGTAAV
jgi:hypothetical protein